MEMKQIKKALLQGRIRITAHTKKRLLKRGYTLSDIISCIWSGERTKVQVSKGKIVVVVEGRDMDNLPIVLIVGKDDLNPQNYAIVSLFPPIDEKFKRVI